jgi:hypothetical protein
MKKTILLLCVLALLFSSCNKDDDNGPSQDLLIGTWKYSNAFEDGVEISLSDCEKSETQIFNADGTFTVTIFDDFDGPCIEDFTFSGTWSNSGNSIYTVTALGETFSQAISFQDNTYSVTTEDAGTVYVDVYTRN